MIINRPFVVLTGGLFVLSMAAVAAVRAQEEVDTFTDIVDVRVINVEVVVTDKNGAPITGLGIEDFQVFADGKPLELTNFYAVGKAGPVEPAVGPAVGPDSTSPLPALPQDATQGLSAVILIDNSSIRPENRKALFERLRRYLSEHQDSEARFMVATIVRGMKIEVPFTQRARSRSRSARESRGAGEFARCPRWRAQDVHEPSRPRQPAPVLTSTVSRRSTNPPPHRRLNL